MNPEFRDNLIYTAAVIDSIGRLSMERKRTKATNSRYRYKITLYLERVKSERIETIIGFMQKNWGGGLSEVSVKIRRNDANKVCLYLKYALQGKRLMKLMGLIEPYLKVMSSTKRWKLVKKYFELTDGSLYMKSDEVRDQADKIYEKWSKLIKQ